MHFGVARSDTFPGAELRLGLFCFATQVLKNVDDVSEAIVASITRGQAKSAEGDATDGSGKVRRIPYLDSQAWVLL